MKVDNSTGKVFVIMMLVVVVVLFGAYAGGQSEQRKVDRVTGVCK